MLARRRRHLLRADRRAPQAQPRAGRLHLRPPLRPRARPRRVRRDASCCALRTASASCRCSTSIGGRRRTTARSSSLEPGELVVAVRLPAPPDASAYLRRRRAAGVLVPARLGRGRAPCRRAHARRGGCGEHPAGARPGRPARRAARATRRAPGSGRCSRRSSSAPSAAAADAQASRARRVVTARMSAMWASRRACGAVCSSSCRILDLSQAAPDLACDRERAPDQIGVGNAVDVRLVGGVEREPEPALLRDPHPEERRRRRDVLVDPRERQAGASAPRGPSAP